MAEVNNGADSGGEQGLLAGGGELAEIVGAEECAPADGGAVGGGVAADVADVEAAFAGDVAGGGGRHVGHLLRSGCGGEGPDDQDAAAHGVAEAGCDVGWDADVFIGAEKILANGD